MEDIYINALPVVFLLDCIPGTCLCCLDLDFGFRIDTSYCILYAISYPTNLVSYSYYLICLIVILMTIPTQPHHIHI